ncbi:MAG: hypothetical protein ACJ8AU_05125 [Gemmatimonadales bacterium]
MTRRLRTALACSLLALATPAIASQLHAQAASVASNPAPGPRYENQRAGFTAQDQSTAELRMNAAAKGPFGSKKNGRIAMIVGGAALIGGLLVDDDAGNVIAVSGLVIGLLGLWTYLA